MTRQGLTRTLALWAAVLLMLASCTIYDDYPHRSQHDIVLRVTDESGNILPDSEAPVDEVYAFVDGIYVGKYAKEADGKIRIVLRKGEEMTFVAATGSNSEEFTLREPQLGERISNNWLQLVDPEDHKQPSPSAIYYGSYTSTADDPEESETLITLSDVRAHVHVHVKGLKSRYGEGNYRVVIEGLNSGICYDGSGGGRLINYEMGGSFNSQGDWITPAATVLPTNGEQVRLKIYKEDGALLFESDHDEEGNPLAVARGSDVVFQVSILQEANISIKILPFEDADNSGFFQ